MTSIYVVSPKLAFGVKKCVRALHLPRADAAGLHWEMFWPCAVLIAMCAAPLGYGFAPLILA